MGYEWTKEFFIILAACIVAELLVNGIMQAIKNWRNRALDINCDNCGEPEKLRQAPDRKHYLCRKCMEVFLTEHASEFNEDEVRNARKWYRRIRRKHKK